MMFQLLAITFFLQILNIVLEFKLQMIPNKVLLHLQRKVQQQLFILPFQIR